MSPFDIVQGLSTSKNDNWGEISEKDYVPFMINRAFSNYYDTVMHAQAMNQNSIATKRMQYDYYRLAVTPKKKRFAKWHKPEKDEIIALIQEAYQVSLDRARSYADLLNNQEIDLIKTKMYKGGIGNGK